MMDDRQLAYDLALQYTGNESKKTGSSEDKADALLEAFKFAYDYYLGVFALDDK